jgi:tetratricopeptide (TPR) repeat protein
MRRATELIREAPEIAEAWNQRAIAHFQLREFDESIGDCHATLERNPFHFGAASGMGQSYFELGYLQPSLAAFERALELNPGLDSVRRSVERLRASLED